MKISILVWLRWHSDSGLRLARDGHKVIGVMNLQKVALLCWESPIVEPKKSITFSEASG